MRYFPSLFRILAAGLLVITLVTRADAKKSLDIAEYLDAAVEGEIYPSQLQIEMLKPFVPEETYRPAPPISDRSFWNQVGQKESAQQILKQAQNDFDKQPEVPITDEIYRRANKEGNRGIYKPRYYRTMERLENAVVAECIENEGKYLPQIHAHAEAILSMKSWLHPNHDDNNNDVLEGRRVDIDLGARKFASVLVLADLLLEESLPSELRTEIREQIEWRITGAYLRKVKEEEEGINWHRGASNWNSVCTGGVLFAVLSTSPDRDQRVAVIGSALNGMKRYLKGFGEDGYCSEGVGYWNYGFGNYLYLSQLVYDYTGGALDLFAFDNIEKMKRVGRFPENFVIQNGIYPCFADGGAKPKPGNDNFAYLLSAKYYGAPKPTYSNPPDITMQIMEWADPVSYIDPNREPTALPSHSFFEKFGVLISRGNQEVPFSIAIKGGHNQENHNHSDVGSYLMVMGDEFIMSGDLGGPPYQAGAFAPTHKMRSSWGHPVPRIDGILQSNGREFEGKVIDASFSPELDRIELDLSAAYEVPALVSLDRLMENDRSGRGKITIRDEFEASEPIAFDVPIMTHVEHEIVDGKTVLLQYQGKTIRVDIASEGSPFQINVEEVKVKAIRYADQAFRIGVELENKVASGAIQMTFTPVDH